MSEREEALDAMKQHKSSWLSLGKLLYMIHLHERFKDWGFEKFGDYYKQELGLSQNTARDMMTAYEYIQNNQPSLLNTVNSGEEQVYVPDYHTVCQLHKAEKNNKLSEEDSGFLRDRLFDMESSEKEVSRAIKDRAQDETGEDIMEQIRKETASAKRAAKRLDKKVHEISSFGPEIQELSEKLVERIEKVEV
jgi:hypothetical protein